MQYKVPVRGEGMIGSIKSLFSREYNVIEAVKNISFDVLPGEMVGYIGSNGAGKSTTIKMLTGVLKPTDGEIYVNQLVPFKQRKPLMMQTGIVFGQRSQLWWDLPVVESFKILKDIYRIRTDDYDEQIELYNDLVNLNSFFDKPVRTLSLGQRMLCEITAAFLHKPKLVFLDEPTIGLDVSVKHKIRTLIKELNKLENVTVILTSHDISDIEALCKRVIIMDKGAIIYDGAQEKVKSMFGSYRTLRAHSPHLSDDFVDTFTEKIKRRFCTGNTKIEIVATESNWVNITIDQQQIPLIDIFQFTVEQLNVKDIQITEVSTENVIQQIYSGALS